MHMYLPKTTDCIMHWINKNESYKDLENKTEIQKLVLKSTNHGNIELGGDHQSYKEKLRKMGVKEINYNEIFSHLIKHVFVRN